MKILITGVAGFIGKVICQRLAFNNKIIGVDVSSIVDDKSNIVWVQADISDLKLIAVICEKYSPDVVIHCAGIAHQKIGSVDKETYMRINSEATVNLAETVVKVNPEVRFVFLSSVSVDGERPQLIIRRLRRLAQIGDEKKKIEKREDGGERERETGGWRQKDTEDSIQGISEDGECWPSSDYAVSKLEAEERLGDLYDRGIICDLVILRLAPVYDRDWSLNLDRRVFAPKKMAYLRFGSGSQRMSALARPNLIDFIEFIINNPTNKVPSNLRNPRNLRMNVCDSEPYEFDKIIKIFKKAGIGSNKLVIFIPLFIVWIVTRLGGMLFFKKKKWIHSCYDKLAGDLVFDNRKMMEMGFRPRHSLETVFIGDRRNGDRSADYADGHRLERKTKE